MQRQQILILRVTLLKVSLYNINLREREKNMSDSTQRIKISVGHGYMLSIIQLAGDLFVECALIAPDGISIRDSNYVCFGPANHLRELHMDVPFRLIWQYVPASMLTQLIHGAQAVANASVELGFGSFVQASNMMEDDLEWTDNISF